MSRFSSGFDQIADDAYRFLQTFCARFPDSVVTLVDEHGWYRLDTSRPGTAPVSITVKNGDPIVVVGIGLPHDQVILEWMADLDSYSPEWWQVHVEPVLTDVASGRVKDATWNRGPGHELTTAYLPWTTAA